MRPIPFVPGAMRQEFTWQDEKRALIMPLLGGPKSPAAEAAVEALFQEVVRPRMEGKQQRPSSLKKAWDALGALLSDLCRYRLHMRDGKHGVAPKDFPAAELGFGRTAFMLVKDALSDAGLIRLKNGWNFTGEGFDGAIARYGGSVTIFRLASSLVERLGDLCGPEARQHWFHGSPKVRPTESLLSLRSRKDASGVATELPYSVSEPGVANLIRRLEELNAFLLGRVEGVAFGGLRRVYNDGDLPQKRWRRGGRYYSRKGAERYELMGEFGRVETILLDGEIVGEVDVRASHLAVLHGVLGLPFDPGRSDPYACGNVHREAVKAFLTASLGLGHLNLKRWSLRSKDAYEEKTGGRKLNEDYIVEEVRSAVLDRYPCLDRIEELGINSLDLQWHEAEVLTLAIESLMARNVPSLPVHDALLVPEAKLEEAKAALRRAFATHFETEQLVPALSVTYGGPMAEAMNL